MALPEDLLAALESEPKAKKTLAKLNAQNRYALAFRLHNMKSEAGRKSKIASFVQMLKRRGPVDRCAGPSGAIDGERAEKRSVTSSGRLQGERRRVVGDSACNLLAIAASTSGHFLVRFAEASAVSRARKSSTLDAAWI
jgi:hypothetical protein